MRSILCLLVVCLFATTTAAQFKSGAAARNAAPAADGTSKKPTNEKGHAGKAPAADQAAADTDLANALLVAMDADHDGVVTKIEMNKAMAALRKVKKDAKGNMAVPDTATAADPNAAAAAGADAGQVPGGAATADGRNNNEAMGRFMQYDTNHNGVLEPNEVPAQSREMLREADTNRDGVIDATELQAFSRKMGARMKAFSAGVNPNGGNNQGNGRRP